MNRRAPLPVRGRVLAGIVLLISGLLVAGALLIDAWRHAQPGPLPPAARLPSAAPGADRAGVATAAQSAAAAVQPPTAIASASATSATPRDARTIATRMLISEFLMNRGRLLADPQLAADLVSGADPLLFSQLARAGRAGDAQAALALHLMHEFLCNEFAKVSQQPNWREETRRAFTQHSERTEQLLDAEQAQHFRALSESLSDTILLLAPRCDAASGDMQAASIRLHRYADDGDHAALIALAYDNSHRRGQVTQILDALDDAQLFEAVEMLRVKDGCEHRLLIEPIMTARAATNPLFAGALGKLFSENCAGAPADAQSTLDLLLRGVVMGDRDSLRPYLAAYGRAWPEQIRIETYALYEYRRRLDQHGCLGVELFGARDNLFDDYADTRGTHLSPYEFNAALERAGLLWDEFALTARRVQRCAD